MADTHVSQKIYILHPSEASCTLVGILEQLSPSSPTQGRKIALILHGTMGHKDYLFQKRLAQRLPVDSFRFDFRGNFESGGAWKQGALAEDLVDLQVVVDYLKSNYGYVIDLVVGHSRGSLVAMRWICTTEEGKQISGFVNVSGRHRMELFLQSAQNKVWQADFAEKGYYDWTVSVARKPVTVRVHPEDVQEFVNWDTSIIWDQFPPAVDVLTLHGFADTTVPPYDAVLNAQALGSRSPGTHVLNFLEGADHNYTGRYDEVVDAVLGWWTKQQKGQLWTGIWSDRTDSLKGRLRL